MTGGLLRFVSRVGAAAPDGATACPEGTFGVFDVVGFTTLSERLERRGPIGAEQTTAAINGVLAPAIGAVLDAGGDVLTFGGDAVSVLFTGTDHERRAAWAAAEVQRLVRVHGRVATDAGAVRLRVSGGLAVGPVRLVGARAEEHAPTFITGPTVTAAVLLNGAAVGGAVLLAPALAARLPASWSSPGPGGVRLRLGAPRPAHDPAPPAASAARPRLSPVLVQALGARPVAEHRPAACAFVALPGTDDDDDARLAERVDALAAAVERLRVQYEICALDTDVGADQVRVLLTAGAPRITDRDEERLLLAVHDLASAGLGLRIGANRGRVFAGEVGHPDRATYTLMGDAVNVAARLMVASEPDRPLVGRPLLERSARPFAAVPIAPLPVKNRRVPVSAALLGPPFARTLAGVGSTDLIGRDDERSAVVAVARSGGAVLLRGPAGVGKSRLLQEARTAAGDRRIVAASGDPYAVSSAYAPLAELVDDEVLAAAGEGDASVRRARLHRAVIDRLRGGPPVLFLLEDLHWFDESSLELLAELAATSHDEPWALVATTRDLAAAPAGFAPVDLVPIADADATRLTLALAGDVALTDAQVGALVARAQGNPLFLRELVLATSTGGDLPDTVEQVIGARIDELAPPDRRLLRESAVGGADVDLGIVGAALDDPGASLPARWSALGGLVSTAGGRLRFDHALVRDVAYSGLPFGRRRELHGRFADLLVTRSPVDGAVVARHYTLADRHLEAWRWSTEAARRARAAGAWVEAADLFAGALRAADRSPGRLDPDDVTEVVEDFGDVCERLGRRDPAVRAYRRALAARSPGLPRARVQRKLGRVEERSGRYRAALRWYAQSLQEAELGSDDAVGVAGACAASRLGQSFIRYHQGRFGDAAALAEQALHEATAADARRAMAQAHLQLEMAFAELQHPDRARHAEAALALFEELDDDLGLGNLLVNLGVSAYNASDWAESLRCYARAAAAYARAGDVIGEAVVLNNRAEILTDQGRDAEAAECLDAARRLFTATRYELGMLLVLSARSRLALRAGDLSTAAALNAQAREGFVALGSREFVLDTDARRVEILAHLGDPDEAVAVGGPVAAELEQFGGLPIVSIAVQRYLAVAYARRGDRVRAEELIDAAIARARADAVPHQLVLGLATQAWVRGAAVADEARVIAAELGVAGLPTFPTLT